MLRQRTRNRGPLASYPKRSRKGNQDGGRRLVISPHPPDFTSAPWYNLVVRIAGSTALVSTTGLQQAIASQLSLTFTGGQTDVRLQRIRLWGALEAPTATSPLQPLSVLIYDPIAASTIAGTGTGSRILEQLTSYPDQVNRAAIGYHYPKAQREFSLRCDGGSPGAPLVQAVGLGANSVLYFDVQWRSTTNTAPTLQLDNLELDSEDSEVEIVSRTGRTRRR